MINSLKRFGQNYITVIVFSMGFGLVYFPMCFHGKLQFPLFILQVLLLLSWLDVLIYFVRKRRIVNNPKWIVALKSIFFSLFVFLCLASYVTYSNWARPINYYELYDFFTSIGFYIGQFSTLFLLTAFIILFMILLGQILLIRKLNVDPYHNKTSMSVILLITILVIGIYSISNKAEFKKYVISDNPFLFIGYYFYESTRIEKEVYNKEQLNIPLLNQIAESQNLDSNPSVILITVDALRNDYFYPNDVFNSLCPEIADKFNQLNPLYLDNFYAIANYSNAGILSTLYSEPVLLSETGQLSIFQFFESLNYHTGAILGGNHRGFDHLKQLYGNHIGNYIDGISNASSIATDDRFVIEKGLQFIGDRGNNPYFLWMHFMSVHSVGYKWIESNSTKWSLVPNPNISDYKIGILQVCELMSNLIDYLDKTNSNTLICITSDHGELLGLNGNVTGHTHTLSLETLHIPMLLLGVKDKKFKADFGTQLDIGPTISNLILESDLPPWKGQSLFKSRPDNELIQLFSKTNEETGELIFSDSSITIDIFDVKKNKPGRKWINNKLVE